MRVVVKQDTRAPLAVVQVWYRVGSSDEPNGITGISHALEHMMFKGTERYPGGTLTEVIKREGARYNAFTGADYTAYYEVIANDRMELAFDIESDRMINLILRQEDFEKEIEVVKEERRLRTEDKPRVKLYEQFYAAAFNNNPYRNPVIGWMDDLNNIRLADLEDWYQKWYAPNNAILIVAGDVRPDEVARLAQQYFAPIPPRDVPARKPRRDTPRDVQRSVTLAVPAKEPHLIIGYPAPVVGQSEVEWHPYALWMLANVLGGGGNSRLKKELQRKQEITRGVSAGYGAHSRYSDMFHISATPQIGVSIETVRQSLLEEIEKIKTELADENELRRALTQARASQIYGRDSIMHQAIRIGQMEANGYGWRATDQFLERVREVTPEMVRDVARLYLANERMITATLDPLPMQNTNNSVSALPTDSGRKANTRPSSPHAH